MSRSERRALAGIAMGCITTGAPLAVLPGYSGAQDGTDDYFAFIDRLCTRVAEAAAKVGEESS